MSEIIKPNGNGMTRRGFLKRGVTFISVSLATQYMMMHTSTSENSVFAAASTTATTNNLLVVVRLQGGNDGLNTVVPITDPTYKAARPTLGFAEKDVLGITDKLAFHPSMKNFQSFFKSGKLAVVNGVGYPNSNLSHFRATDIWETAAPDKYLSEGWLGNFLDMSIAQNHTEEFKAASIATVGVPLALIGHKIVVPAITTIDTYKFQTDTKYQGDRVNQVNTFVKVNQRELTSVFQDYIAKTGFSAYDGAEQLQKVVAAYKSSVEYGKDPFAQGLKLIAQMIAGSLGTQILFISIGGFDTHANQAKDHETLWSYVDGGLASFYQDLQQLKVADNVLMMTYSEFGRRVRENGSRGTDHGTAAPMFVLGNKVKGGLYSEYPSLTNLDSNSNLIHTVDFRSVYNTILEDWMGAEAEKVLGGKFDNLHFLNS
ncbi:DUF1501 domain-containing protein [Candidatus Acetothermia bacterium]|nr:DUF1501 domain-containing protein [Candidatus Acetothermia bacterium]